MNGFITSTADESRKSTNEIQFNLSNNNIFDTYENRKKSAKQLFNLKLRNWWNYAFVSFAE